MPLLPRIQDVRVGWVILFLGVLRAAAYELREDGYHVFPKDELQQVLNIAATNTLVKTVHVHEGTYAPRSPGQALIHLNRAHDGIRLLGVGRPVLTAANPDLADRSARSFPAVVNHVVYCGDGLSSNTVLAHFRLTGANHFVTNSLQEVMEPDRSIPKGRFYYGDGGAVKIYHRSYPVLRDLEIVDNYCSPCAGGISIQHEGATNGVVLIEDCVFRGNRAEVTGAALDLLWGSEARVVNCLFVGNISNTGPGEGENPFSNNGAVTVFPRSRIRMERCTLTGNRNGVDELGGRSSFMDCLFYRNTLKAGVAGLPRFELDLPKGGDVSGCVIAGRILDPLKSVSPAANRIDPMGLELGADFSPLGEGLEKVGYRKRE
ncbi:MAG: hypothetical protein JNL10_21355 [Verrucomicrobiales bacterium]|nr:hypothetical protein [Verrucomicrobiales bacterium]